MTFDELVGAEPTGEERDRLRNVHELLLEVGPPAELSPQLEAGPTLAMTLSRLRTYSRRRRSFLLTAVAAAFLALIIGIGASMHHGSQYPTIAMRGVSLGTGARGTLELLPTKGTTQKMKLDVTGLPRLGGHRFVVYLVRNGVRVASCGSFTVPNATRALTVKLVSPYRLRGSDSWIVALQSPRGNGLTVMQPTA